MYRFPLYLSARHGALRDHVRAWIADHPDPAPADFARGGLIAPGWPSPWGLDAGLGGQLVVRRELAAAGLAPPVSEIEVNWIGPTILRFGSEQQRARYLWPLLEGAEYWCRLHSEPDAGSDLAMVATRAERTADGFLITGQKTWTYMAGRARFGALLARTSGSPGDPEGISYFIVPMDAPGITLVPIEDLGGGSPISEVFLDGVELPADHLIGELGAGLAIRRPYSPHPNVAFNPGLGAGHDPAVLRLLELAGEGQLPGAAGDALVDLYLESQSIDALALLDAEEDFHAGGVSHQRADIRRWLTQELRRSAMEWVHDVRAGAVAFDRQPVLERLDGLGLTGDILRAAVATVPNGGSDIHLETITARVLGGPSAVLTAWAGEAVTAQPPGRLLDSDYEMLRASLQRFAKGLPEPGAGTPPELTGLQALVLRDLLAGDDGEPDVDWLAWLVTFEELGGTPIGPSLLASVGLAGILVHLLGGRSDRATDLRDAALAGDTRLALAVQEPGLAWARGVYATQAGGADQPRLTGSKLAVAHASAADVLIVVAARNGAAHVYALDPAAPGVTVVEQPAAHPDEAVAVVRLDNAPAAQLSRGDSAAPAVGRALSFARVAMASASAGAAAQALDLAVEWLQHRRQFGRPLREFQAVSHRCGRSRIRLEQMRALAYRGALEGAGGDWPALDHSASAGRLFCADGYASIAAEAMRVQGAIGITWENALAGHFRRAHWLRDLLGGRATERQLVLEQASQLTGEWSSP